MEYTIIKVKQSKKKINMIILKSIIKPEKNHIDIHFQLLKF